MFGGAVVDGAQRQKALVGVLSWTWHSIPITGRKPCVVLLLARAVLSAACSLAVITRWSIVHAVAAITRWPKLMQNPAKIDALLDAVCAIR